MEDIVFGGKGKKHEYRGQLFLRTHYDSDRVGEEANENPWHEVLKYNRYII